MHLSRDRNSKTVNKSKYLGTRSNANVHQNEVKPVKLAAIESLLPGASYVAFFVFQTVYFFYREKLLMYDQQVLTSSHNMCAKYFWEEN